MNTYERWMLNLEDVQYGAYELPDDVPLKVSLLQLHPMCRGQFALLQVRLFQAYAAGTIRTRFAMFQGYRSPEEQDRTYAQGRTKPGEKVTNAQAWLSAHQFGLAVDFVPHIPGTGWSWDEGHDWKGLREMAEQRGLKNSLSWDKPHVWHPAHDVLVRRLQQSG